MRLTLAEFFPSVAPDLARDGGRGRIPVYFPGRNSIFRFSKRRGLPRRDIKNPPRENSSYTTVFLFLYFFFFIFLF